MKFWASLSSAVSRAVLVVGNLMVILSGLKLAGVTGVGDVPGSGEVPGDGEDPGDGDVPGDGEVDVPVAVPVPFVPLFELLLEPADELSAERLLLDALPPQPLSRASIEAMESARLTVWKNGLSTRDMK